MGRGRWAVVALALLAAEPAAALGICVEGNYPPFSEVLDDGSIVGFDIDIAEALCARIGEDCTLVLTSWDRMIPALTGGACDAIVASMSDTAERRQEIDFTERYYKAPVRFVAPSGPEGGRRAGGDGGEGRRASSAGRSTRPSCGRTIRRRRSGSTATRSTCCST